MKSIANDIPAKQVRSRHVGFTLVELLVVIAIIGVLVSLLLPAVQSARESARRMNCRSNIRQLSLGINLYEDAHTTLPRSGLSMQVGPDTFLHNGQQLSWIVLILPYIEETTLYNDFVLDFDAFNQLNEPQEQQPQVLLCPSDGAQGRFYQDATFTRGKTFAKGNYAAFVSPVHTDTQVRYPGALINEPQELRRIVDGISKTIVLSEIRTRDHPEDQRGAWALAWNATSLLAFDMHEEFSGQWGERYYAPYQAGKDSIGLTQTPNLRASFNFDVLRRCPEPENAQVLGMECGSATWISAAPRSTHPGGVNVAYLDGSIAFVRDDVDEFVMAYSISINDEQSMPSAGR